MIPKTKHSFGRIPKSLPIQPKHNVLIENNRIELTVEESKAFLREDKPSPNENIVAAVRRNKHIFGK